ncbi:MAG TPA: DUF2269 family protein [Thermoleophilaceae bacterium]|nr:DUF2269 family protein [Thermoleophilaceae bacterium]
MGLYELLLFVHIAATVVWVGSGFFSGVLGAGYSRDADDVALLRFAADQERLAPRLFIPASLTVLVFGIALVIESDAWSFDELWVVLGLLGFLATFFTGLLLLKPATERIRAEMEREGGRMTPQLRQDVRKVIVEARVDQVVLFLVILDMVAKPTRDDVELLILMAAVLAAGIAYIVTRLRAIDAEAGSAPATA